MSVRETAADVPSDSLPSTTLIPNSALLRRSLARLPKSVIIDLVLIWLDHPLCPVPQVAADDEDYFMEDETLDDKRSIYESYREDSDITKKTVIDKILGNDWVISPVCPADC